MKHLYDNLRPCQKEEEVKAEFCKFFKMKIFALRGIDHYTERVLFEFKYDRNFRNPENMARVLAQTMYYARLIKFGAGLTKYPLPPCICVVDKNEAFFTETKDYARFYADKGEKYDWDRAPSTPCPKLVADILAFLTQRRRDAENAEPFSTGLTGLTRFEGKGNPDNPVNPVKNKLSPEARAVLDAARTLYREFYANLTSTPWMDWKIETWDVGFYQVRNAMKDVATKGAPSLRIAHDALRAKILPQIYTFGFLNPDVVYFT